MSQFYARYVPSKKPDINSSTPTGEPPKRKREEHPPKSLQDAKVKRQKLEDDGEKRVKEISYRATKSSQEDDGKAVLKKYGISDFAQQNTERNRSKSLSKKEKRKKKKTIAEAGRSDSGDDSLHDGTAPSASEMEETNGPELGERAEQANSKHSGIMSRFERSKEWFAQHQDMQEVKQSIELGNEDSSLHGLEPIPQPQASSAPSAKLSFSILAPWQSDALRVDQSRSQSFASMNLSKETLANLEKSGMKKAFPIQSTVIPLLLGDGRSATDLCISAATGSGKTLAYVIPIVENLRRSKIHKLRAVIVVPTRELVQQVKETCEICAVGSGLRIVTAVGTKAMKEEQDALIQEEEVYDPNKYRKEQQALIDWSTFDLVEELESAQSNTHAPYFVTRKRLRPDILITTPGRLVDHLRNTSGFHLHDTEWLVVDEADRLLNESYQEWIESVIPALSSRQATHIQDEILRSLRLDLPTRMVRKVLLSATMTRDISKLNALGLQNPRLVVLESHLNGDNQQQSSLSKDSVGNDEISDVGGYYHIPPSLSETALALADGSEKPMILLQLLQKLLNTNVSDSKTDTADITDVNSLSTSHDSDTSSSDDSDSETTDTASSNSTTSASASSDSDSSASTSSDESRTERSPEQIRHRKLPHNQKTNTSRVLIFTKSTASASRLSRLLSMISADLSSKIATLTRSTSSSASSRKALSAIRSGKINVLIATDRASRGIDIPSLENVVNYDIPASALTYVHRVGRSARAGLPGHAWSLVEHREGRWFWNEIGGKSDGCTIRRSSRMVRTDTKVELDDTLQARYENALQQLGEQVRG